MRLIENSDGTRTAEFQSTDICGVDLERQDEPGYWTLTFYDDGDPVVIRHVPQWQLEHLQDAISGALKKNADLG
jgi:hypothetical protein